MAAIFRLFLGVVLAVGFLMAARPKLAGDPGTLEMLGAWGYPAWFVTVLGVVEVVGAVALLLPRFTRRAAALLGVVVVGAIGTHLAAGEWGRATVPAVYGALLAVVFRLNRPPGARSIADIE